MVTDISSLADKALWTATLVMLDAGIDADQEAYGEQVAEAVGELTQDKEVFNQILEVAASKKPFLSKFILKQRKK